MSPVLTSLGFQFQSHQGIRKVAVTLQDTDYEVEVSRPVATTKRQHEL